MGRLQATQVFVQELMHTSACHIEHYTVFQWELGKGQEEHQGLAKGLSPACSPLQAQPASQLLQEN